MVHQKNGTMKRRNSSLLYLQRSDALLLVFYVLLLLSSSSFGSLARAGGHKEEAAAATAAAAVRKRSKDYENMNHHPPKTRVVTGDIVGGTKLSTANIPSYYAISLPPYALCGAVLIHAKYLLTAAHCQTAFTAHARLVASNTRVNIQTQHVHPLYYNASSTAAAVAPAMTQQQRFQYDLMVLELEEVVADPPVMISYHEQEAVIASSPATAPASLVWTLGYGVTNANATIRLPSETLQQVNLTVIPSDECRTVYDTIGLADRIAPERVFCTFDDTAPTRRDTCHGDSGSPVVRWPDNRLVGIVSWGRDCAGDYPAVHMTIDLDFIDRIVPPCTHDETTTTTTTTATTTNTNSSSGDDGYYAFHYWPTNQEPRSSCIDLHVNRMFRVWKSMNFTCGRCADTAVGQ
jgi:secreted trypsin-like serine protease